nr:hypothetical protein BaRGS_028626 [Batillaria attramentaria]
MDENSELPADTADEVPENDTQQLSQDDDSFPQPLHQSEDQADYDYEPEGGTQGIQDNGQDASFENTPPEEPVRKQRSHRERSSRRKSRRHRHSKRSRRHRDDYPPEEDEDPIPPGSRGEVRQGDSVDKEMEDGEILEDGEIATDEEDTGGQERVAMEVGTRPSFEEEEEEGAAGGESEGEQSAVNENEPRVRPRWSNKRKRMEREKRKKKEKEEKKKKSRRHGYVDHDRVDEDGGNRWSGYQGGQDEEEEYSGRFRSPHHSSPVKRQDSRDPFYYGGRDSPPGLYDSPSEDSDEE